jgi:nicotinate-nucleotide adenylyltransferase
MCELAFSSLRPLSVSRIESELPTPSRTLFTLQALTARYPGAELRLVVGADVVSESKKWHAFDAVIRLAPLFVVGRGGQPALGASGFELPPVSSTHIRELFANRADVRAAAELRELVPAAVLAYAEEQRLYTGS